MNSPLRPPSDDPLYALPDASRPHYATGMLLVCLAVTLVSFIL